MDNNYITTLAERIIDVDFYGARDAEETVETMIEHIKNDPEAIIEYLLDVIEDYQSL